MSDVLVLVCKHCRWRPPGGLVMSLVEAHFDLEDGHDPTDIRMDMVAWCHRCGVEMPLDRSEGLRDGRVRYHHSCPRCRRSAVVVQAAGGGDSADTPQGGAR
jgi:hypothetical protein